MALNFTTFDRQPSIFYRMQLDLKAEIISIFSHHLRTQVCYTV